MSKSELPDWYQRFAQSFRAAEAWGFLIHGDLNGYQWSARSEGYALLRPYLYTLLGRSGGGGERATRIVLVYDQANGFRFPLDTDGRHRAEASGWLVGEVNEPTAGADPLAGLLRQVAPNGSPPDPFARAGRPGEAIALIGQLLRSPKAANRLAVVLDYGDYLLPPGEKSTMPPDQRSLLVSLISWMQDQTLADQANPVLILAPRLDDLHPDLRASGSGWRAIEIPLPTIEERLAYATYEEGHDPLPLDGIDLVDIGRLTAGLNLRQIEDIILLARGDAHLSADHIKARKAEIVAAAYARIAEMIDPLEGGFAAVGGMEWLNQLAEEEMLLPLRQGDLRRVPKGIALFGPPGTGKTYWVRALAGACGFNVVALRAENIMDSLVGASERNLRMFFDFARMLAPTIIFIDEIDQGDMAQRGGGSGNPVAKNLYAMLMQFLSDETVRGRVIVVMASNRPDLIDGALLRAGRIDLILPVLLPDAVQRSGMLITQAREHQIAYDDDALSLLVERTEEWSAADLAAATRKAAKLAGRADATAITAPIVEAVLGLIQADTPRTSGFYTRLAIAAIRDREYLPPCLRALGEDRAQLASEIARQGEDLGILPRRRSNGVRDL